LESNPTGKGHAVQAQTWKVGELAKRTGLSVRTLHYYEEIGLLKPSGRTEAGHRLFTADDVVRLQRIMSLRELGFSLEDIKCSLDEPGYSLAPLIDMQLTKLTEQIALQQRLYKRLSVIRGRLLQGEAIPVTQFLEAMEAMMNLEKYLTPEQIKKLQTVREQHGDEGPRRFKAFVEEVRGHMQAGDAPTSETVQALAARWKASSMATTGGDQALGQGLQRMLRSEPEIRERFGLDDALFDYLGQMMAAVQ
jgi:DNA-binding transcriptional MerR regulator